MIIVCKRVINMPAAWRSKKT